MDSIRRQPELSMYCVCSIIDRLSNLRRIHIPRKALYVFWTAMGDTLFHFAEKFAVKTERDVLGHLRACLFFEALRIEQQQKRVTLFRIQHH